MWKSLGKLYSKLSLKWQIIIVVLGAGLIALAWFIAKKIFFIGLVIGGVILIGSLINKFRN